MGDVWVYLMLISVGIGGDAYFEAKMDSFGVAHRFSVSRTSDPNTVIGFNYLTLVEK